MNSKDHHFHIRIFETGRGQGEKIGREDRGDRGGATPKSWV